MSLDEKGIIVQWKFGPVFEGQEHILAFVWSSIQNICPY